MWKFLSVPAACLMLTSGACAQKAPSVDGQFEALDQGIQALLIEHKITSVSFAVIESGQVTHVAAFGEQSPGVPASTATLYNIASLTKPLTAEIILRAASQGRISLDEPMSAYWTDPDLAGDDRRKRLTPRLALSHQTGLPNWRDKKKGLSFMDDPGTRWGYSGEGYDYVSRFAERKLKQPFEQLAQQTLFGPLRMMSTSYTLRTGSQRRVAVPSDNLGRTLPAPHPSHYSGADLVYSTASDYGAFMVEVLKNHGLSPTVSDERNRIQVDMTAQVCDGEKASSCPRAVGFSLGWQILDFADQKIMMHTGKDDGIFTFAYLNRTTKAGVVIFTNSDNGYKIILPMLVRLDTSVPYLRYLRSQINEPNAPRESN